MKKDLLRRKIKTSKSLLTETEKIQAAESVFDTIERSCAFTMAKNILLYNSLPDELSTRRFIDKWCGRKHFYLPRVNGIDLDILPYDRTSLRYGAFNIEEPQGDDIADVAVLDLIIVPGVAFDRNGNRVGRGRGYYDRLLRQTTATKIGVGYDFQLVDAIDAEPHDIMMDIVITPSHIIHSKK